MAVKHRSGAYMQQEVKKDEPSIRSSAIEIGPFKLLSLRSGEAIAQIRSAIQARKQTNIAICNAHTLLTAFDDRDYARTLQSMTLLNDGIGINIANNILNGRSFPENLNGTDFIPQLLREIDIPLRIYLLGAKESHLTGAAKEIADHYPQHEVVGLRNGYFDSADVPGICQDVADARADLLLVAMGNPRQERFIVENQDRLQATVAIGVGALFDFMSGSVVRAPKAVQLVGLEWLFRLLQEPKRLFRRYVFGIPRFLFMILRLKRRDSQDLSQEA